MSILWNLRKEITQPKKAVTHYMEDREITLARAGMCSLEELIRQAAWAIGQTYSRQASLSASFLPKLLMERTITQRTFLLSDFLDQKWSKTSEDIRVEEKTYERKKKVKEKVI